MQQWLSFLLSLQLGAAPPAPTAPVTIAPAAPAVLAVLPAPLLRGRAPLDGSIQTFSADSVYPDDWFAEDKLRHFFMSFAAMSLAYGAVRTAGLDHGPAEVVAVAGAAAAGVWKEFHDRSIGRPFSRRDLVWDGLGILAGLILATQTR